MSEKYNELNDALLNFLLSGDRDSSVKLLTEQVDKGISLYSLYEDVIKPVMYKVGELWENNKISVATEHLAAAIIESGLNSIYLKIIKKQNKKKKVILTCLENEYHQIGAKMVSDVFETKGWESYFLGANTPTKELIDFIKVINPDLVGISLSIYFHIADLEKTIAEIRKFFPDLPIILGGQAFAHGGKEVTEQYPKVNVIDSTRDVEAYISRFNKLNNS